MRLYMEGSVTAEQLQDYVVRYKLKDHFEKLKEIEFFSKFLLLPNKKTNDKSNQHMISTVEQYEAIFFPSGTINRWKNNNHAMTKKKIVEDLTNWTNHLEEREDKAVEYSHQNIQHQVEMMHPARPLDEVDFITPRIKLSEMLSLLFDSITGEESQLLPKRQFEKLARDKQRFEKNLFELIKFLTHKVFLETDQEFSSRLKLMIVLAIKIKEGYEVVKPVWVRRPEDKWGSKFVLRRKSKSNRFEFLSIFEGKDIDKEVLTRSQKIGFNTHADQTNSDVHIKLEDYLGMYVLNTPSLVGEELVDVFDREFGSSINAGELNSDMKKVLQAMFKMFDTGTRNELNYHDFQEEESIHCFGNLYPRLEHNDVLSRKIKPILSNAQKGLNNHNIFTELVFTTVTAGDDFYYWAHCDEWGKNCFYDDKNEIMSWLDFEDSIFTKVGITDLQFSGGRCWKRLISSTEDSEYPKLEHINAISSLGRLITACLQYYSVRDVWRDPNERLSMRPNLCSEVLTVILDSIENWCNEYTEQEHVSMKKRELFPKKIKSQFLLACYDWAVHWDNHREKKPPVRHRSWCDDKTDNTNVVYHAFTATILKELENILGNPKDASQDKDDKSSTSDIKASIEIKPSQINENLNVEPSLKSSIKKHISDNKSTNLVFWDKFVHKLKTENQPSYTLTFFESLKKYFIDNDLNNIKYDSKSGISKLKIKDHYVYFTQFVNQETKQKKIEIYDNSTDRSPGQEAKILSEFKSDKNQFEYGRSSEDPLISLHDAMKELRDVKKELREIKETLPKPLASVDSDYQRSLYKIKFQLGNSEEGLVDARSFAAYVNELSQDFGTSQSKLIFKDSLYELEKVLAKFQEFIIHDCDGGQEHPNQNIFTIYQQSEKMLIEFLFRIYEPKFRLRRNMIERIVRRSIIRRGILDLYLDGKISAECEAYFSAWTKRPKYNFLLDIFRWFLVIDDEAERNIMALIRYHNDKEQLEKIRRNLFKKRRGSNQYSRSFISLMDEFVDSKDRWNFVKFGLFEELVTWELDKMIFLK